mmetsp:Transcript_7403/g.12925  ORF Transcript_7403/g.12925 Transcript_7403/m.12925 type:complete len:214 (+) Transcript_7403:1273-1914(+)
MIAKLEQLLQAPSLNLTFFGGEIDELDGSHEQIRTKDFLKKFEELCHSQGCPPAVVVLGTQHLPPKLRVLDKVIVQFGSQVVILGVALYELRKFSIERIEFDLCQSQGLTHGILSPNVRFRLEPFFLRQSLNLCFDLRFDGSFLLACCGCGYNRRRRQTVVMKFQSPFGCDCLRRRRRSQRRISRIIVVSTLVIAIVVFHFPLPGLDGRGRGR